MDFTGAAREWHLLLRDVPEAFVARHFDSAMQLAVALHCQNDLDAQRAVASVASAEHRDFVALSLILRRLVEMAIREHMTFLLPATEKNKTATSAALKSELLKQQKMVQSLPEAFREKFRQLLETHWGTLTQAAEDTTVSLPRVQQLHWKVTAAAEDKEERPQTVALRLQTTDGRTRKIQVPIRQFHQLRHSVATVLQEMNEVEAHPMMRLAYMEQSRRTEGEESVL